MTTWRQRFALSTYDNRWQEYFCASRCIDDRKAYLAVRVCLFASVLAVFIWSVAVCCGRRTRKIENDDLNRRASAMSIELVRRRSSINYDNLPVNRV